MFTSDDLSSLRWDAESGAAQIIDQTLLPHTLSWVQLDSLAAYCHAISAMQVRGAPLIGITAAFGLAFAIAQDCSEENMCSARDQLLATRPTAINLRWAVDQVCASVRSLPGTERAQAALACAISLREADVANCARIGAHGLSLLRPLVTNRELNVMTHCNAGWLATIQWGTALAPIYKAHEAGVDVHVWVSETRPRNQGMNLTAWELQRAGVHCTVVADNSCGQLMREGKVDCVVVGSDRTAANGDVCNKIGTYLKALSARDNNIPFYVALPESTIDWHCPSGADIPIEERDESELLSIAGLAAHGAVQNVKLAGVGSRGHNPAFDVTPARLVDALITEYGVIEASPAGMQSLLGQVPEPGQL